MEFKLSSGLSVPLSRREIYSSLCGRAERWAGTKRGGAVFPLKTAQGIIDRNFKGLAGSLLESGGACGFDKWLYDNHYLLTSAFSAIESENKRFKKLPSCESTPRIFLFCRYLLGVTDCRLDAELLDGAVTAFQKRTRFGYEELVYLPLAFKCAVCERIAALIKRRAACDGMDDGEAKALLLSNCSASAAAAITFLREAENMLRYDFVLKHSAADSVLSEERSGVYPEMREDSKGDYLAEIARISCGGGISETDVARAALRLADKCDEPPKNHVGYYLFRSGRRELSGMLCGGAGRGGVKGGGASASLACQRLFIAACFVIVAALCASAALLSGAPLRYIYPAVSFPIFLRAAKLIALSAFKPFFRPFVLPGMDFTSGIPGNMKTAVVTSVLAADAGEVEKAVKNLAANSFADRDKNISYVLLVDFMPSQSGEAGFCDKALIETARRALQDLKTINGNSVSIFFRKRRLNAERKNWAGWERKRGAIMELCEYYLKKDGGGFYEILGDKDFAPELIAVFDADTAAPPKALTELVEVAAHPLNGAFNVFVPRIRTNILTTRDNLFTRLFADCKGFDAYSGTARDAYQDIFQTGIFHGKGLFRLKEFYNRLDKALPENRILSHDLIEGAFAGAVNVKTALYDTYPGDYTGFVKRCLRWVRGDWQLLPYLLPRVRDQSGAKRKNPLQPINNWQIFYNACRSLAYAACLPLILLSPFAGRLFWLPLLTAASPFAALLLADVYGACVSLFNKVRAAEVLRDIGRGLLRTALCLVFLPHFAVCVLAAVSVTLVRLAAKRNLLVWNTFAHTGREREARKGRAAQKALPEDTRNRLIGIAENTWAFFKDTLTARFNYLPCDNFQEEGGKGFAPRTSPTNIGFGLLAAVCAAHFGFISRSDSESLICSALKAVKGLPKYKGHLYNWYDVITLKTLWPAYVSSVDSGNFCACLIAVRGFLIGNGKAVSARAAAAAEYIDAYLEEIDFSFLYDGKRHLFRIGYNESANSLSDSHYDLLASESHLLSLTAIALGKAESKNWRFLSRAFVRYKGICLRAWTGGMFEYLMASLLVKYKRGTLVYESNRNAARGQVKFAREAKLPVFGISESQYNVTDRAGNYQYKAFGVNAVSLKATDAHRVVSPYSAFLALEYLPEAALKNLKRLRERGLLSDKYGFYEAADFTEGAPAVLKSWMAHHQGMILCALTNYLCEGAVKEYFCGDSRIASVSLYLTERAYRFRAPRKGLRKAREIKERREDAYFEAVNPKSSRSVNLLGDGKYRVLTDERGCGRSVFDGVLLTRSRFGESCGFRFFILDLRGGGVFDSFERSPERAVYRLYESVYTYEWQDLIVTATAAVSAASPIELRKITVMNRGETDADLRIASYFEPVLCAAADDIAHPVFSNLFISTSYDGAEGAVTVRRGNRSAPLLIHGAAGLLETACETNRFNFFERASGGLKCLYEKDTLPKSTGFVLEPCVSLRGRLEVARKSEASADFYIGAAWSEDAARKIAAEFNGVGFSKVLSAQARENAAAYSRGKGKRELAAAVRSMAAKLLRFAPSPGCLAGLARLRPNLADLSAKGINLNYPVYVYNAGDISDCKGLKTALEAAAVLYKHLIKFNFCITYSEKQGYNKPVYDALCETVGAAGLRDKIGADGGIIFYNIAAEYFESAECLRLMATE